MKLIRSLNLFELIDTRVPIYSFSEYRVRVRQNYFISGTSLFRYRLGHVFLNAILNNLHMYSLLLFYSVFTEICSCEYKIMDPIMDLGQQAKPLPE